MATVLSASSVGPEFPFSYSGVHVVDYRRRSRRACFARWIRCAVTACHCPVVRDSGRPPYRAPVSAAVAGGTTVGPGLQPETEDGYTPCFGQLIASNISVMPTVLAISLSDRDVADAIRAQLPSAEDFLLDLLEIYRGIRGDAADDLVSMMIFDGSGSDHLATVNTHEWRYPSVEFHRR